MRALGVVLGLLMLSWASLALAQPANSGKSDKLARVTYNVADLVVPIPGYPGPDKQETLADALVQVITNTVAKSSWKKAGGDASVEYFPLGMALVVHQRPAVHGEITRLLDDLRRLQDTQVSVQMRMVETSPTLAKRLLVEMEEHGRAVRAISEVGKESSNCCVTFDDKQTVAFLETARSNGSDITDAPKMTMFNGQRACISSKAGFASGFSCELLPVVDADKSVRLSFSLQHCSPKAKERTRVTKASGAFIAAPNRTLVWHLGETSERRQLFVLATPRVVVVQEEAVAKKADPAEEQSAPEPKAKGPSAKERAIEKRLREPITLHFKDMPLHQVVREISTTSGIALVLDTRTLENAKINLDAPFSISVDNIAMKSALNILFSKVRLTYVIDNEMLKVTTEERTRQSVRVTYPVVDLILPLPAIEGQKPEPTKEQILMQLIRDTIAKDSWEENGGRGKMQYFPMGMALVVEQNHEVQEDIQLLLATLRRLNDLMVSVDIRFVTASATIAQDWHQEMRQAFVALAQDKAEAFLRRVNQDTGSSIMQLPKVTFYNGQRIPLSCTHKQVQSAEFRVHLEPDPLRSVQVTTPEPKNDNRVTLAKQENVLSGWRCDLTPVVSPDRRSVRLTVNLEHFVKDDPRGVERVTKAARVFNVLDGNVLVWDLGPTADRQHLFAVITPRIHVRPEPEQKVPVEHETPIPGR